MRTRGMTVTVSDVKQGVLGTKVYWKDSRTGHENCLVFRTYNGKVGDQLVLTMRKR